VAGAGKTGDGAQADADPRDARIAQLEAEANGSRVEAGRVKALQGRNTELEAKNRELEARLAEKEAGSMLPDNIRENVPDEYVQAAGIIGDSAARRNLGPTNSRIDSIERKLEERERRESERATLALRSQVEGRFPGFLASVEGGDKTAQWVRFREMNGQSVDAAAGRGDFGAMCYFIELFYRELGVSPDAGGKGGAAPDPRVSSGGTGVTQTQADTRRYSFDEYAAILDKTGKDFRSGLVTLAERNAVEQRMQAAFSEGRVDEPA